ncbi:hypothetical protein ABQJ48_12530 [Paraburkholderia sp. DGU8]
MRISAQQPGIGNQEKYACLCARQQSTPWFFAGQRGYGTFIVMPDKVMLAGVIASAVRRCA